MACRYPSHYGPAAASQRELKVTVGQLSNAAQNVWMNNPERSFGSNHVLFGGMI